MTHQNPFRVVLWCTVLILGLSIAVSLPGTALGDGNGSEPPLQQPSDSTLAIPQGTTPDTPTNPEESIGLWEFIETTLSTIL